MRVASITNTGKRKIMELWQEIAETQKQLDDSLAVFRKNGIDMSEAERQYQMEKSKQTMRLKDEGYPATLIPLIVKGLPEVVDKLFERDKAVVVYKANQEAINIKKLELNVLKSQYEREYSYARND